LLDAGSGRRLGAPVARLAIVVVARPPSTLPPRRAMSTPTARPLVPCPNFGELREPRVGVMLHYDDSASDAGAVSWFTHPDCKVSYNYLVLDDGAFVPIVPEGKRAWHAGTCASSDPARLRYADANSAFVGVAVATNDRVPATAAQVATVAWLARREFARHGWPLGETWRIVGHEDEAVWPTSPQTPLRLRGKRGRKIDPTGPRKERPILSTAEVRRIVAGGTSTERAIPAAVATLPAAGRPTPAR
jgi:hypothetical protein